MSEFNHYIPKNFCREFVEIKGNSHQLGMYMALALGFKPLMDDWIPKQKIRDFQKVCKKYKIYLREDIVFLYKDKNKIPKNIIGRENLTTTCAYAFPLDTNINGEMHIFLSKDKNLLKKGMWYPLIIKDRVIFQPRADGLKYGYTLGYPDCCIKFFRAFNDWSRYSYLYEAYKKTKNKPSFLCNPFLKDTSFSYIYHMPCSYSCQNTIKSAGNLRKEIKKREPEYAELIERFLKSAFLVFYEKKIYCFKGKIKNGLFEYKDDQFISFAKESDTYGRYFKKADSLKLEGRRIALFKNRNIVKTIEVPLNKFAPEFPFLIQFS